MHRVSPVQLLIILFVSVGGSVSHGAENLEFRGFVAQGGIWAQDSNFVDDDGNPSLALTEAGLSTSYRFTPELRAAGQLVYLDGGNRYPQGGRLDYLFLDWSAVSTLDWQLNVHVGRYKNYHWFYSAVRDVPPARPSIILPQSIYFDTFRDVALGSDGISLLLHTNNNLGEWEVNWSYGSSEISKEQTRNLLSNIAQGRLDQDFAHQFTVKYRPSLSTFKFSVSLLDSDFTYTRAPHEVLTSGTATSQRQMLALGYSLGRLELVSELLRERVIYRGVLAPDFFNDSTAEGGYFQAQYQMNSQLSVLARIDLFDRDHKDRAGDTFFALSAGTVPRYFSYMDQATFGISWDFNHNWRLRGEFHRVKGTGRLAPVLRPDPVANHEKYWNILALQLIYWF